MLLFISYSQYVANKLGLELAMLYKLVSNVPNSAPDS